MHFIYKLKNLFRKHKYAFMQIWLANLITDKYILPKWNRMSIILEFPIPQMDFGDDI